MTWAVLRNTSNKPVVIKAHDRDTLQLGAKTTKRVDAKFLWQLPDFVRVLEKDESLE